MINYVFLILGIIVISFSLFLIKKEFKNNAFLDYHKNIQYNSEQISENHIVDSIESIEAIIGELNEYFYNTIIDIEEKYNNLEYKVNILINEDIHTANDESLELNDLNSNSNNEINGSINAYVQDIEKHNEHRTKTLQKLKILELKSQGLDTNQIAKELNIGIGEVQLVLNIYKK